MKKKLVLESGEIFHGESFGFEQDTEGEVVFNTGMTGYQELISDPSYCGQIITFTFPHIGNVGVNLSDIESKTPKACGLIIRDSITNPSSYRSQEHFNNWLIKNNLTEIRDKMDNSSEIAFNQIEELRKSSSNPGSNYYWIIFVLMYASIYFLQ